MSLEHISKKLGYFKLGVLSSKQKTNQKNLIVHLSLLTWGKAFTNSYAELVCVVCVLYVYTGQTDIVCKCNHIYEKELWFVMKQISPLSSLTTQTCMWCLIWSMQLIFVWYHYIRCIFSLVGCCAGLVFEFAAIF